MTSTHLMLALCVAYLVIAAFAAREHNWPRVLYWVAATMLNLSVIWGTRVTQ